MSWKDYFYFQKRDRIAIILLFILIAISGGIYVATIPTPKSEAIQSVESEKSTPNSPTHYIDKDNSKSYNLSPYSHQEKLKQGETIELNSSDTSALKKIPGIGTAYANRIVKYRNLLGGFVNKEQLKEVWGMDNDLYNKINPYILLTPKARKLNINTASFKELLKHPYIDYKQAKVISDIKERKGKIESIDRLSLLEEFTENDLKRLTPYLSFD